MNFLKITSSLKEVEINRVANSESDFMRHHVGVTSMCHAESIANGMQALDPVPIGEI